MAIAEASTLHAELYAVFVCPGLSKRQLLPGNGLQRDQGLLFYKIFTLYAIYSVFCLKKKRTASSDRKELKYNITIFSKI
jgi:hypothetical protein